MVDSFWVDEFIRIGSRRELNALVESVDAEYRITGAITLPKSGLS